MKKIVLIALLWGLYAPIYAQCSAIIDLNTWVQEGPPASGNWAVNLMGTQLTQSINGWPTFFVSPQDFINVRITGTIRVNTTGDDDFVGFVFGWQPMGNTGPNYTVNGMLFDWKQGNQTWNSNLGLQGKILSNIDGYTSTLNTAGATASTFWGHVNQPPQFNVIAQNTGNGTGWQDNTTYAFSLTYLSNRTVIKIDADTIFDISGCFSPGRFGFYNYSQSQVIYSNFAYELIPDFTMATANVCLTDSAHFQFVVDSCANLNQNNFPISNWLWDFGDGSSSNLVNPTHLYASPGIYPVKLVTRDSIGCTDSVTKFITIDSVPPPPVLASNSPLCDGDSLSLTGMLVPNTTVSWTGPNGFSSSLQNPVINPVSPASAGTYACTLFYGVCPGLPDSLAVIVHPLPPGLAPTSNSPICTDSTLLLTAAPVTGGSYSWTGPNGFASNLQNPSLNNVTTAQAGNYVVFATANGCIGPVDSTTVTVNPTPIASIAGDTTLCIGDVTMLLASGGNTYLWSNSQTSATISLSPLVNTTYSVVATDADGCPSLPRSVTLLVSPLPTPMLGPDTSACDSFLLDAGPGYLNYLWSTGATTQTVAISATGLVWVEVMSTDSCLGRDSVNITINVPSPVSLGPDLAKCAWDSITLNTNPSGFSNYVWNTAATTSTITVGSPGIYAVTVTNGNGCLSNDSILISNHPVLSGNIGADTTVCGSNSLLLDASVWGGSTFLWSPGNVPTAQLSVNTSGQYAVIIDDGNGCLYYDTINVVFDLPPAISLLANPTDMCAGNPATFTASPSGLAGYLFTVNGSSLPLSASELLTVPSAQTSQTVTVSGITAAGCTTSVSAPAVTNVVPRPTGNVSTTIACAGDASSLSVNTLPGNSITWTGADGLTGTGSSVSYVYPSGAGTYAWSVTIGNGLCDTTLSGNVVVTPIPAAPTAPDVVICPGDDAALNAEQPGGAYAWYTAQVGGPSVGAGPTLNLISPMASGTYYVATTVNGCTSPRSPVMLTVSIPPIASFISSPDVGIPMNIPQSEVIFSNLSSGASSYFWNFGDQNTSTLPDPNHIYTKPGNYQVYLIATNGDGCTDTIFMQYYIVEELRGFYVPTAFTPNADGLNDDFTIVYIGYASYEISIFDRWGKLIFNNNGNSNVLWNGEIQGQPAPEGVYVYRAIVKGFDGKTHPRNGSVTILR